LIMLPMMLDCVAWLSSNSIHEKALGLKQTLASIWIQSSCLSSLSSSSLSEKVEGIGTAKYMHVGVRIP
jgi:hypothetical protein